MIEFLRPYRSETLCRGLATVDARAFVPELSELWPLPAPIRRTVPVGALDLRGLG